MEREMGSGYILVFGLFTCLANVTFCQVHVTLPLSFLTLDE